MLESISTHSTRFEALFSRNLSFVMVFLLYAFLTFTIVSSAPTATVPLTTTVPHTTAATVATAATTYRNRHYRHNCYNCPSYYCSFTSSSRRHVH
ncbi:hypothetical protein OSTOST_19239 [Ostertagia ostertagi]